ncbi:MAG TPA: hypothetical protein VLE23_03805 [Geminicoccaceae bacterium]|nr:hypothetical protein [Geminicoccaceae bacterium]
MHAVFVQIAGADVLRRVETADRINEVERRHPTLRDALAHRATEVRWRLLEIAERE